MSMNVGSSHAARKMFSYLLGYGLTISTFRGTMVLTTSSSDNANEIQKAHHRLDQFMAELPR